jgi:catechol 2,3-dioxygenase
MTTQPLDLDSIIRELPQPSESEAIANGTVLGHVHLKVSNLENSLIFYRDGLGFDLMRYWSSAAFLSAGRYHHHIGMNTWESLGGPPSKKTSMGLEYFEVIIPESDLHELSSRLAGSTIAQAHGPKQLFVSDPDNISLLFRAA